MTALPFDPTAPAPPGGTLRQLLRATPRLAPDRAAALLANTARAAAVWHARGAAHGALTPERVLVGAGDAVTLAPPPRLDGAPAPWPTYLAPEQVDGRPADVRSDLYALGLLGWEMLAGQQPWEGESLYGVVVKQREQDLPRLSTLRPGLPRALVAAVEGCLHKAPGDRWESAAEFLAALAPALPAAGPTVAVPAAGAPVAPPAPPAPPATGVIARAAAAGAVPGAAPPTPPPPPPTPPARARPARPGRRGRWLTGAVLGLALAAAAGGAVVAARGRDTARATQTWLDSVSAPAAAEVGAAAAATTTENTTAVPVRRAGGGRRAVAGGEAAAPSPDSAAVPDSAAEAPAEAPALEPTPPFVPPAPGRPIRPTVPRPDTASAPDSLAQR